jgi:hypothetical protein
MTLAGHPCLDAGIHTDADGFGDVRAELEQILTEARTNKTAEEDLVRKLTACFLDNGLSIIGQVALAPDGIAYCAASVSLPQGGTRLIEARCP